MAELLLREVCDLMHISRRALQGYEKEGLVTHTGKTDRGYYLYDEMAQQRIREIRFYQDMKFKIREIKELIDAPREEKRKVLEAQIKVLEKENQQIKITIDEATKLLEKL